MKAWLIITGNRGIVILASYSSISDSSLLERLGAAGIHKFVAYEIPQDLARQRYANRFSIVAHELQARDDLRVLDFDGHHAFNLFRFAELGTPTLNEEP